MDVREINKEWGDKFVHAFNTQEAAIIFAFAMTKTGQVRICTTTDLTPEQLKEKLKGIILVLGG